MDIFGMHFNNVVLKNTVSESNTATATEKPKRQYNTRCIFAAAKRRSCFLRAAAAFSVLPIPVLLQLGFRFAPDPGSRHHSIPQCALWRPEWPYRPHFFQAAATGRILREVVYGITQTRTVKSRSTITGAASARTISIALCKLVIFRNIRGGGSKRMHAPHTAVLKWLQPRRGI
jgi:hypothetical protein